MLGVSGGTLSDNLKTTTYGQETKNDVQIKQTHKKYHSLYI